MLKFLVAIVACVCAGGAHKILVIFPLAGKSHSILGHGIARHLLNAGHEVTLIMPFPSKPHPNLTTILNEKSPAFSENTLNIKQLMDKEINMADYNFVQNMLVNVASDAIKDDKVQKLLRDPTKTFDLVIGEWLFCELYTSFAEVFKCPFIWSSSLEPHWLISRTIDEYMNPAYNADALSEAIPPFTFMERIQELWSQIQGTIRNNRFFEIESQVYESHIVPAIEARGSSAPSYSEVVHNVSIVLGNSHVSMGLAPRLPQNYKPIGGYHIDSNVSPLPKELQNLMDNSKHGVIYFSMGSNLKSKDLPEHLKKGFLDIFRGLKQTVLWKFEEVLPDLPKNVHILKWAPQPSILAHPKCILFITHGGLLSTTEAVHFGVPVIGIPVFADQFGNVRRVERKGFGRLVELSYTMDVDLRVTINDILGDPSYVLKAKYWSMIYHDRLSTPGQELVHWAEHVVKTRGARHLRSEAFMMPWYQKHYIDLLAIVVLAMVLVNYSLIRLLRARNSKSVNKQKVQ